MGNWRGLMAALLLAGCGNPPGPGSIEGEALPDAAVEARASRQLEARAALAPELGTRAKQILFGDLHVHTTYSPDAFFGSLPMMNGEGMHPIGDACDFARYCADLDFWSINDHAFGITPDIWRETKESIRQCNAVSGDPRNPDLVAFLGWEWTQMGRTVDRHYGHKNVMFLDTREDRVPARPIAARVADTFADISAPPSALQPFLLPLLDFENRERYYDLRYIRQAMFEREECPDGIDTRELSLDCRESTETPDLLFEKLEQWSFDTLVIPHGTSWGMYTPPGSSFEKQLRGAMHDPERQTLFEIYSGHGNSEEYRDWRGATFDAQGELVCPEPTPDYLPCCWRAGELIQERCEDPDSAECQRRVEEARRTHLALGPGGHLSVSGEDVEDWLDCGQCRDCFTPAFNYRPGNSAQYALAISNFDGEEPRRFHFGFISSSDTHSARAGTGYKEYARRRTTEGFGPRDQEWLGRVYNHRGEVKAEPVPLSEIKVGNIAFNIFNWERGASFFLTGGLVAAHSAGRDRSAIWQALAEREVYGTSGPRILLWFDLLEPNGGTLPMGSATRSGDAPRFRVRAAGALEQKPGCPEHALQGLDPERLAYLCHGECYNPGDERHRITHIEVVRIRPQIHPEEAVESLIEDPWRRFECPDDPTGCAVEFEDPDFAAGERETVYYVRALQEATPVVNGGLLRCEYDEQGRCVRVNPCYGDYRTPLDDDCLTDVQQRAWSSPIRVSPL
jgi:hypothetical protein